MVEPPDETSGTGRMGDEGRISDEEHEILDDTRPGPEDDHDPTDEQLSHSVRVQLPEGRRSPRSSGSS